MPDASLWIVEIDAHDGSSVTTLRYGSSGYNTKPGDTPANTHYEMRIAANGIGSYARHLFSQGMTRGQMTLEPGDLSLSNADGGLDGLLDYGFDRRAVVLKQLANDRQALSVAATVLTASGEALESDSGLIDFRLRFYDRRRDVDTPIQSNKYGGTTTTSGATADGSPDMKGQVKPLTYGAVKNVRGALANPYDLILQVHDGAVDEITAYDGGIELTPDGDHATLAGLQSATGNPGHYATCLAEGLWRPFGSFNGRPAYVWTADVVQGDTASDRTASAIVEAMLTKIGLTGSSNIDASSFSAFATTADQELGIHIDRDTSCLSAIREVLDSVGGWIVPDTDGVFQVGRHEAPNAGESVLTLVEPDILTASSSDTIAFTQNPDTDGNVPAYRVVMKWGRIYHVHTDSDLGGSVTVGNPDRATELKTEWREAADEDGSVQTKHPLAPIMTIEGLFADEADAQAEAERLLALYGTRRESVRVAIRMDEAGSAALNSTVTIQLNRLGYGAGKAMRIIGREDAWASEQAILTLWG